MTARPPSSRGAAPPSSSASIWGERTLGSHAAAITDVTLSPVAVPWGEAAVGFAKQHLSSRRFANDVTVLGSASCLLVMPERGLNHEDCVRELIKFARLK